MTTKNQIIFENLLHGFNVPLPILKGWANQWGNASAYGQDENCIRQDPVPLWEDVDNNNSSCVDLLNEFKQSICTSDELKWMQEHCDKIIKNCDIFIDAITNEIPNETYILFGRDCWPLSLRMTMRKIKHYYIEGASRGVVNKSGFKEIMSKLPCPVGCVLIDTGYRGSIPEAYLKAHNVNKDDYYKYKIRLISASDECRSTKYTPVGYLWQSDADKRHSFCESMEDFPKFYGRSVHTDYRGYPVFRICRTAYKAYGYYLMMLNTPVNGGVHIAA